MRSVQRAHTILLGVGFAGQGPSSPDVGCLSHPDFFETPSRLPREEEFVTTVG